MTFQAAVKKCFSGYVNFEGRAPRSEYWWFQLFYFLVVYLIPGALIAIAPRGAFASVISTVVVILMLGFLLPILAVSVRRLHDRNRSGWNILWSFLPLVGGLVLLIWFCMRGTPGDNRFGPDPLPMSGNVAEVF